MLLLRLKPFGKNKAYNGLALFEETYINELVVGNSKAEKSSDNWFGNGSPLQAAGAFWKLQFRSGKDSNVVSLNKPDANITATDESFKEILSCFESCEAHHHGSAIIVGQKEKHMEEEDDHEIAERTLPC